MASLHFHSFWSSAGERFRRAESSRPVSGRGLRQKPGQPPGRQGVSVLPHLLGGGNDDPHGGLLLGN